MIRKLFLVLGLFVLLIAQVFLAFFVFKRIEQLIILALLFAGFYNGYGHLMKKYWNRN